MDALPPDYQEEIDAALRKQRLAQVLLQQSMQQRPSGQMVSGHYIPDSPLSRLAQVFQRKRAMEDDAASSKQIASARRRFSQDQMAELSRIQGMSTGSPGGPTPNFVMQSGEGGEPEMANTPAAAANPLGAEQAGQRSQFPAAQALGKALMDQRLKMLEAYRKELMGRVGVNEVGRAAGATPEQEGLFSPRQKVEMVDGVPVATPSEYVPGGQGPARIGPGYSQTTVPGSGGRPLAAQQNPLTGKLDVLDKAPRVEVNTADPTKATAKITESQYELLAKNAAALRERAVRSIPRMVQVTEQVKQGIVQGTLADPRKAVIDFARLLGVGDKEFQALLDRTGSAEAALAQISAETIKQYGANPSNVDLINQRIATGSLSTGPQALYLLMQAAQADLLNTIRSHEGAVERFEGDFPEMNSRTRSLRVGQLPRWSVDGEAFGLDEQSGLFNFNPEYKGMPGVPRQGILGPTSSGGKKPLSEMSEQELRERLRQLQGGGQ